MLAQKVEWRAMESFCAAPEVEKYDDGSRSVSEVTGGRRKRVFERRLQKRGSVQIKGERKERKEREERARERCVATGSGPIEPRDRQAREGQASLA